MRTAFEMGVAGTFVFAWTDEWFTGGHLIEDWAFGLVDRDARAEAGLRARCASAIAGRSRRRSPRAPRVSVVVCAYNAERTMEACLDSLEKLNYPDYEVIVVNDGSKDRTLEIAERFRYLPHHQPAQQGAVASRAMSAPSRDRRDRRLYRQRLRRRSRLADLSRRQDGSREARRLRRPEFPAARGQPGAGGGGGVAGRADPCAAVRRRRRAHRRLQHGVPPRRAAAPRRLRSGLSAPRATMSTSAGGCRTRATPSASARRRWSGISAATRSKAYIGQQRGYGKAEALVYSKHPFRFNLFGQAKWLGRIYGDLSTALLLSRRPVIYSGVFGRGLFQTLYEPLVLARRVPAAHLRMERGGDRAGAGRHRRRRLDVAPDRAARSSPG